jgi:hypothetical protein
MIATIVVLSHGMILRPLSCISLTCGPCRGPLVGVDLPGIEGSLGARRGGGKASGRKGPRGAFREGIRRAWGPFDDVGGATPERSIAPDLVGGRANDIDA